MLTNEILPAIPRQKVFKDGYVYNVLAVNPDNTMILQLADLSQKEKAIQIWSYAKPEDCEHVPEKPRPLRIGDKVCATSEHGSGHFGVITSINATRKWYSVSDFWFEKVRLATPSEVAQYFN